MRAQDPRNDATPLKPGGRARRRRALEAPAASASASRGETILLLFILLRRIFSITSHPYPALLFTFISRAPLHASSFPLIPNPRPLNKHTRYAPSPLTSLSPSLPVTISVFYSRTYAHTYINTDRLSLSPYFLCTRVGDRDSAEELPSPPPWWPLTFDICEVARYRPSAFTALHSPPVSARSLRHCAGWRCGRAEPRTLMSLLACPFLAKQATFIDSRRNTVYPRIAKTLMTVRGTTIWQLNNLLPL